MAKFEDGGGLPPGEEIVSTADADAAVPQPDLGAGCEENSDCTPNYCDTETGLCVECLINSHCPPAHKCKDDQCVKQPGACSSDAECTASGQVCDPESAFCVDCLESSHCDQGKYCIQNKCLPWICTPSAKWCVGSKALLCNADGSAIATEKDCDDGDKCTVGDACLDGLCLNTAAMDCDDHNACTDDGCDPVTGCWSQFNALPCDDGTDCTTGDFCANGVCVSGEPVCDCVLDSQCQPFEDNTVCNGKLHCEEGSCLVDPETVIECPPTGDPCVANLCMPDTGKCKKQPAPDGAACDDGNACTTGDACGSGNCQGKLVPCADDNPCTQDVCDPKLGCVHQPVAVACDDGDLCTWPDTCFDGVCLGAAMDCEDGNPCTKNFCKPGAGCQQEVLQGLCEDGSACTQGDVCTDAVCAGQAVTCKDDNLCTNDSCHPLQGCVFAFNNLPCNDGNACTVGDHCSAGECVPGGTLFDCEDGNPCTTDSCDAATGECHYAANSQPCEDGDPCTEGDLCVASFCKPGAPKVCDDANSCTDDYCDKNGACQNAPRTGSCDDGNACTNGDSCLGGQCQAGPPLVCKDDNLCTDESCDPTSGCKVVNNANLCNDYNVCTPTDQCKNGACVGSGAMDCEDYNPCTLDSCSPGNGCDHLPLAIGCDDENACTDGDYCAVGICLPGKPVDCDDKEVCTDDSCDQKTGCKHAANSKSCDDGNPCTFNDACANGKCKSGELHDCNDGNTCTQDVCNGNGCLNPPLQGACDDGNQCTTGDQCTGGNCIGKQVDNCGCHSLKLDGATGYGGVPSNTLLNFSAGFTLECWWKQEASANQGLMSRWGGSGTSQRSFRLEVTDGNSLRLRAMGGNAGEVEIQVALASITGWHHAAAVYDGAQLRLYLDGVLGASSSLGGGLMASDAPLYFGGVWDKDAGAVLRKLKGNLDEVRISSSALYAGPSFTPQKHLAAGPDTVAYWGADQVDFKTLFDLSGHALHAWLFGTTSWSSDTPSTVCVPVPNYPPSTPGIAVKPPNPEDADALSCTIETSSIDIEGDPVTYGYQWLKNGAAQPGMTTSGVPASATSPCPPWQCSSCEVWTCVVTPSDGKPGYPASASSSVGLASCKVCDGTVWGNHCYKLFTGAANWDGAYWTCANWGGHLVTIASAAENAFVDGLYAGDFWIGLNDVSVENWFVWVNSEQVVYTNWRWGEPNNSGNEDCAQICQNCGVGNPSGLWNDAKCNSALPYVCEKE